MEQLHISAASDPSTTLVEEGGFCVLVEFDLFT